MNRFILTLTLLFTVLFAMRLLEGQVRRGTLEVPNEVDPGVMAATLIEKPEIWVTRVQVRPGAVRGVHTHDDVMFHLIVPVDGPLQLTAGEQATEAKPWQVTFMKGGTPHGFRNIGATTVTAIEVFVRPSTQAVGGFDDPNAASTRKH
jgi:quercetin dioxygenase-like cupin family protein